jgi:hypothetical protein
MPIFKRGVGLARAVEGAGHEGVVLGCVGERHELGAGDALGSGLGHVQKQFAQARDGVEIHARPGGGQVEEAAEPLG